MVILKGIKLYWICCVNGQLARNIGCPKRYRALHQARGGLISGISIAAKSLRSNTQVLGVQSVAVPIMSESIELGQIVKPHKHDPKTIAEGLLGGVEKGSITFEIVKQYVDEIFLV